MEYSQIDITDMQCWVFRMAQKKWKLSARECADIFKKYDILRFIEECYDTLHLSGYQTALEEVEEILASNGVTMA